MSTLNVKDSSGNWKEIPYFGGYTKDEVNKMVEGKANQDHTHTLSQITDFAHKMKFTLLCEVTGNSTTTVTLSQSVLNFDLLIIKTRDSSNWWQMPAVIPAFTYTDHPNLTYKLHTIDTTHYVEYYFPSSTSVHISSSTRNLVRIYGVNIG